MNNPKNTRKCCACQGRADKQYLIRVVAHDGQAFIDESGKAGGRGAYVHKNADCLKKLRKKNMLSHALKTSVPDAVYEQIEDIIFNRPQQNVEKS